MDMLTVRGLHKSFGDKQVLRGLDLTVPEHSLFGFIGRNGAGKTTAMKAVLGLLRADSGSITVGGEEVTFGQSRTNRFVGYLPDVPEFYGFMTAGEYLAFCGEISGMEREDFRHRSEELLELVGLSGERHRIRGFSRGMKQRLGIAQALMNRPRLLICDEPTSALDPMGRRDVLDLLLRVREQTTVLFSTHILADVERICTDVALLDRGVIALQGKLNEVKASYSRDEYALCTASPSGLDEVAAAFPETVRRDGDSLIFADDGASLYEIMRFLGDRRIPTLRLERLEPTLESLFMEATDK